MKNKRVVIVSIFRNDKYMLGDYLPLALLYLGTYLKKNGYDVEVKCVNDDAGMAEVVSSISKERPLLVGISAMFDFFMPDYIELSKKVKQIDSNIPVVFGGLSASANYDLLLKEEFVDYVVKGEGEVALLELCEHLIGNKELNEVRNLHYSRNNEIVSNNPLPLGEKELDQFELDFDLFDDYSPFVRKEQSGIVFRGLQSSRGCPFSCTFCLNNSFNNRKFRFHSVERFINDVKKLREKVYFNSLTLYDYQFFGHEKRAKEIIARLYEIGIKIASVSVRMENVTDENLKFLLDHGINEAFAGIESENERILKVMKKELTFPFLMEKMEVIKRHPDFQMLGNIMLGIPTQTEEEIRKSIRFYLDIHKGFPNLALCLILFGPIRGTEMYNQAISEGLEAPKDIYSLTNTNFSVARDSDSLGWLPFKKSFKKKLTLLYEVSYMYGFQRRQRTLLKKAVLYPFYLVQHFRLKYLIFFGWKIDFMFYRAALKLGSALKSVKF